MNIGNLTFNSKNSLTDFGVYITGSGTHNAAELDTTVFQIAGRNGDLVVSNNRYKNIQVLYPAFIPNTFASQEQKVRNWLQNRVEYSKLADTYDTTHFRLARPVGELTFEPTRGNGANFEIAFDCDPRRFLTSGDVDATFSALGSAHIWGGSNPTGFVAKPLVKLSGIGVGLEAEFITDTFGTVTLTATTSYADTVVIDCEIQDVYDLTNGTNLNDLFTFSGDFPAFGAGANRIIVTGTHSSALVKPRWWEL